MWAGAKPSNQSSKGLYDVTLAVIELLEDVHVIAKKSFFALLVPERGHHEPRPHLLRQLLDRLGGGISL